MPFEEAYSRFRAQSTANVNGQSATVMTHNAVASPKNWHTNFPINVPINWPLVRERQTVGCKKHNSNVNVIFTVPIGGFREP